MNWNWKPGNERKVSRLKQPQDPEFDRARLPDQQPDDPLRWRPLHLPPEEQDSTTCSCSRKAVRCIVIAIVSLAGVVGWMNLAHIKAFLSTIGHLGPGWDDGDKVMGLTAFGLVLVAILAAMRICLDSQGRREQ